MIPPFMFISSLYFKPFNFLQILQICYSLRYILCYLYSKHDYTIKSGLSPSQKHCFIYFIESPLKMIKNAFYFILKALFIRVEKTA